MQSKDIDNKGYNHPHSNCYPTKYRNGLLLQFALSRAVYDMMAYSKAKHKRVHRPCYRRCRHKA